MPLFAGVLLLLYSAWGLGYASGAGYDPDNFRAAPRWIQLAFIAGIVGVALTLGSLASGD